MISQNIVIDNKFGIHARPAGKIANLAVKAKSNIWIINNGKRVDASDIFEILTLACEAGTKITFEIDEPCDKGVLEQLVQLVKNRFGE